VIDLIQTDDPPAGTQEALQAILGAHNADLAGGESRRSFAITIPDAQGAILGGLWAHSRWGSFCISLLVVPEAMRGQGLGRRLIKAAEAEARRRDCYHIWLDTFAFQARGFYEGCGFEVFGTLEGRAPAHPRYFMKKALLPG
jgi:GNAT superfamily N-acetyltransferase